MAADHAAVAVSVTDPRLVREGTYLLDGRTGAVRWFKSRYAQDFNFRHGRGGHVFAGRFYSGHLQTDDHFVAALVYVFLNPVRAGVAAAPEEWEWSSFRSTVVSERSSSFVDVAGVLEVFGPERSVARARLRAVLDETLRLDRWRRATPRGSDPRV